MALEVHVRRLRGALRFGERATGRPKERFTGASAGVLRVGKLRQHWPTKRCTKRTPNKEVEGPSAVQGSRRTKHGAPVFPLTLRAGLTGSISRFEHPQTRNGCRFQTCGFPRFLFEPPPKRTQQTHTQTQTLKPTQGPMASQQQPRGISLDIGNHFQIGFVGTSTQLTIWCTPPHILRHTSLPIEDTTNRGKPLPSSSSIRILRIEQPSHPLYPVPNQFSLVLLTSALGG